MATGVKVLRSNYGRANQAMRLDVRMKAKNVAEAIKDNAKELAPVGTEWEHEEPYYPGYMRDHIVVHMVNQFAWGVEAQAFYSIFVELGTVNMDPQPFMVPAYQKVRALVDRIPGMPSVWRGW